MQNGGPHSAAFCINLVTGKATANGHDARQQPWRPSGSTYHTYLQFPGEPQPGAEVSGRKSPYACRMYARPTVQQF